MMKKFISALILTALLLSSILAIVPASAAEATDRESILVNSKSDQFAGKGPAFYYDYHLYEHEVGEYPLDKLGKAGEAAYMLRSLNSASGSASFINGDIESWNGIYNNYSPSDAKGTITDKDGKTYDFDAWCGISIKETATVSGFSFYTLNESTKGSKHLIEELMLFGAVVDPALHTYAPNSWFPMTELIKDVQVTSTDDGKLAYVTGDFDKPYDIDYLFMALNMEGESGGSFAIVEIELYECTDSYVDINELDTSALTQILALAKESIDNENGYTADSYAALSKAYDYAKKISEKTVTNQQTIDRAVMTVYTAISELVPVADTSGLVDELSKYETLVETDYTLSSWKNFTEARDAAIALVDSGKASEAMVNEHIAALTAAAEALAVKATEENFAALKAKVDGIATLDGDTYTSKSFSSLKGTVRDANVLLTGDINDVSVAQCETAIKNIEEATAALKERADFDALKPILEEALAINSKEYTSESYAPLLAAITEMQTFLSSLEINATAEEGEALVAAIETAKKALVALADFTDIDAKIAELEALVSTDYTEESWKALQDAIAAAKALKTTEATKEEADDALKAINAASKALLKKSDPTDTDEIDMIVENGCGGIVSVTAVVVVASLGFGVTALKRK
jgi:hypothetical protein